MKAYVEFVGEDKRGWFWDVIQILGRGLRSSR